MAVLSGLLAKGAVMDPIAQAAGTALVQAIATDAWQQVKQAVTGLWHRVRPGPADLVGGDLDELRTQVLRARADGDAETEQALERAWQLRLRELLRADPALAVDLRQVLDQVLAPAAGQGQAGAIVMTGISRDTSSFTQIGSQVNYGRS
jgi:hypothetical protein